MNNKELIAEARESASYLPGYRVTECVYELADALEKSEQENAQLRAMWQLYGAVMKEASEPTTDEVK